MSQKQHSALFALPPWLMRSIDFVMPAFILIAAAVGSESIVGPAALRWLDNSVALVIFGAFAAALWVSLPIPKLLSVKHRWKLLIAELFTRVVGVFIAITVFGVLIDPQGIANSKSFLACWFLLTSIGIIVLIPSLLRLLLASGLRRGRVRCVFVAVNESNLELARRIRDDHWLSVSIAGFFEDRTFDRCPDFTDFEYLGKFTDVGTYAKQHNIERVYISLPQEAEARRQLVLNNLLDTTADIFFVHDFINFKPIRARSELVCGVTAFSVSETPSSEAMWTMKGLIDKCLALLGLIIISPILLITALMIKLDSRGPVFFRQTRYGINGDHFQIWKFRSMTQAASASGNSAQAKVGDARVTRVGAFIRRTSIDELPQLFNILTGDMSLVGPRPHAAAHNEQYRKLIVGYMVRHKVLPGLTGWAQVNGWRGETETLDKMQQRVAFDLEYMRHWSVGFDLYILMRTVGLVLSRKNAY
jgi:putative colanic acid biosysnthesis UDP-glucose lipid carrier transferase